MKASWITGIWNCLNCYRHGMETLDWQGLSSLPSKQRSSASWTLDQMAGDYAARMEKLSVSKERRLILLVYQWRHSIIFLKSFAVIACSIKAIFVGNSCDIAICAK